MNAELKCHVGKEGRITKASTVYQDSWFVDSALTCPSGHPCSWKSKHLEPIQYDGNKVIEWSECLWQPSHLRQTA